MKHIVEYAAQHIESVEYSCEEKHALQCSIAQHGTVQVQCCTEQYITIQFVSVYQSSIAKTINVLIGAFRSALPLQVWGGMGSQLR